VVASFTSRIRAAAWLQQVFPTSGLGAWLNLLAEGCRDPLVLWGDILIDGHNRYDICSKHNIPFQTVSRDFGDISEAFVWVEDNQLGRRNLTPDQFKLLLGRKYNRLKNKHGGDRLARCQFDILLEDSAIPKNTLAEKHGVSASTVARAGADMSAIDIKGVPELIDAVEQGRVSVSTAAHRPSVQLCL